MIRRSSCDIIFASNDEYLEEEHFELRPVWCQFHLAEELDELVAMGADRDEMYKLLVEPKDNPYHDTHYSFVEPFDYSHRDFVYVKSTFVVQDWIMEGRAVLVNAELRAFDFDDEHILVYDMWADLNYQAFEALELDTSSRSVPLSYELHTDGSILGCELSGELLISLERPNKKGSKW